MVFLLYLHFKTDEGFIIFKKLVLLILLAFLIFLGIATIFPQATQVGTIGKSFGLFNQKHFGYISFVYPFLLILPIFILFKKNFLIIEVMEKTLSSLLFLFGLLIFQAMIITGNLQGHIGKSIVLFLVHYIGKFGIWILIVMIFLISIFIFFDEEIIHSFKSFFKKKQKILQTTIKEKTTKHTNETSEKDIRAKILRQQIEQAKENIRNQDLNKKQEPSSEVINYNHEMIISKPKDNIIQEVEKPQPLQIKNEDIIEETKKQSIENLIKNQDKLIQEGGNKSILLNELEENKKLLEEIEQGKVAVPKDFMLPKLDFLKNPPKKSNKVSESEIDKKIQDLLEKLKKFNINGDVIRTYAGPVVTTFEFKPAPHIKVSKILTLQDDLAMALRAETIRIQAPIPGKDVVGIEIPNIHIDTIYLKDILQSDTFNNAKSPLTIALGKDIVGNPFITDLKKLPHLLIAGTTGSGKSVGINSMILSLLYRNSPKTLRLLMIDPKMLEFSMYNEIPHLLAPVITQPKQALIGLESAVLEMERRFQIMSKTKTKNIESYNQKASKEKLEELPYIVIIIDELADLMMTSGKEVEVNIARLAQKARASGIHLIVATQRPSVDVVTGLIKANLPSRISYRVGQKIDSKVILDSLGAESLLGRGDMLFTAPNGSLVRLHAPFASEDEIDKVVDFLKTQNDEKYETNFIKDSSKEGLDSEFANSGDFDELFDDAKEIILTEQKTSISYIQRRLNIGYNRAANIIEQLEKMGVLSAPNTKGQREIL